MTTRAQGLGVLAVFIAMAAGQSLAAEAPAVPYACLFDTGASAPSPLLAPSVAARRGWTKLAEDDLAHTFAGDAVLAADQVTVVLRAKGPGAEVYAHAAAGPAYRAALAPLAEAGGEPRGLASVRIVENSAAAVTVEAAFGASGGATVRYRLTAGQAMVEVRPGAGAARLLVRGEMRYLVVPDFFGDDMVFGPGAAAGPRVGLPADNFLLNLVGGGDAIMMCVWQARGLDAEAVFSGDGPARVLSGCEIACARDKPLWVALLEGRGLWHERTLSPGDVVKAALATWKPAFPAKWRADILRDGGWAESVTLGDAEAAAATPVVAKAGPAILYPIDRSRETPLTTFTPIDIVRSTLGVGPCQYILESEGLASKDNATPDEVMTWVERQFRKKGGSDAADDIRDRLGAMVEQVGRVETKVRRYADLAAGMRAALAKEGPEAARPFQPTVELLAQAAAAGLAATQPPGRAAKLADAVAGLVGKETAAADAAPLFVQVHALGAAQQRALARCRMVTRWLREVARSAAKDERAGALARTIQARAEKALEGK